MTNIEADYHSTAEPVLRFLLNRGYTQADPLDEMMNLVHSPDGHTNVCILDGDSFYRMEIQIMRFSKERLGEVVFEVKVQTNVVQLCTFEGMLDAINQMS